MSHDAAALKELGQYRDQHDRTAYYRKLIALHDPYGTMALGVVKQSNLAGVVARRYAIAVSERYCKPIDDRMCLAISNALMDAELAARTVASNSQPGTPSLH